MVAHWVLVTQARPNFTDSTLSVPCTGKSIGFERHRTAPEIWLVLKVGIDPLGPFLCGENLFKLAN